VRALLTALAGQAWKGSPEHPLLASLAQLNML
jgi:hypothetical protein